ncbi:kinase-like domain-containing protein [Rhodocollybia butyracea]|uniref:Kinase-like domain-containing protein n=1 Tax=Rhodocollybia butyracea TaxID=206335 RepID=A0A9P5U360_9AGAR|nr:kinase-like domain-containing protein [Rhodocollybia butyracea]
MAQPTLAQISQLVQNRLQQVRQQPDHERVRFLDVTQQVAPLHPALGVRIGRGSFGNVYAAEWTCPQPPDHTHPAIRVVVKVLDGTATLQALEPAMSNSQELKWSTEDVKKAFILEAKSWVKVTPHENVLSLIGFTFSPSAGLRLVMPRIDQPKLQDGLDAENTNSTLTYQRRCALILDVANGLAHLHSLAVGLVHGDLHPGNIFMHQGRAIIADFGLAKPVVNTERVALHKFPGHILYSIVPELIRDDNTPRTMEVDIYMFGCIAKIIFTRRNGALHAQNDNITLNQPYELLSSPPPPAFQGFPKAQPHCRCGSGWSSKKKRSATANAPNPHHSRNYANTTSGTNKNGSWDGSDPNDLLSPFPWRFLAAEIPKDSRGRRGKTPGEKKGMKSQDQNWPTSSVTTNTPSPVSAAPAVTVTNSAGTNATATSEWLCVFCEYELFFGDEGEYLKWCWCGEG